MLPKLTPRLYSISSSPSAHAGQVHTTVAVVRYSAHNRERGGVCSTLFADRVTVSDRLPIYIQPNKKFRLPKQPRCAHDNDRSRHRHRALPRLSARTPSTRCQGPTGSSSANAALPPIIFTAMNWMPCAPTVISPGSTLHSRAIRNRRSTCRTACWSRRPMFWNGSRMEPACTSAETPRAWPKMSTLHCRRSLRSKAACLPEAAEEHVDTMKEQHRYHRDVY